MTDPREVQEKRPLAGYGVLLASFFGGAAGFATWLRSSKRSVPDHVELGDLLLIGVATHKAARLVTKDRVTAVIRAPVARYQGEGGPGEVEEAAEGTGLRRAVGELIVCPYCIGMWIAAGMTGSLIVAPRFTRWSATALAGLTLSDFLQIAYKKAEQSL